MTVSEAASALGLQPLSVSDSGRELCGVYIGDLLSHVMANAEAGCIWITIMSNVNVVAVASMCDCAAILLAEGVMPDSDAEAAALSHGISIYSSQRTAYELAVMLNRLGI